MALVVQLGQPQFPGQLFEEPLGEVHHVMIVDVGLVEFKGGKLGIVLPVHPLVAKIFGNLIHPFEAADEQALQI